MPALLPQPDPEGLLEYSVVYTDRALNHMSLRFQGVMRDISRVLKTVYAAQAAVIVPGSGTFGMEAVARQVRERQALSGHPQRLVQLSLVADPRHGRHPVGDPGAESQAHRHRRPRPRSRRCPSRRCAPPSANSNPTWVFAPHVETSAGILLPDDYICAVGAAARESDALFVLDCIASGTVWVVMRANQVDVLISAPPKGLERSAVLRAGGPR